ncbi:MAG: alpha/beta fold hydrolase [Chloroflexi bacterium]|nr:alpha/beta fold hydrolase [Chloroflexota bacterium]
MPATLADDVYAYGLSRYPVPYDSLMVDTPLARTHVLISGPTDAPPVLLIHGAGMNALAWINQIEPLSRHFRVVAVDLPGQSGLSDPVRLPMTGSGVADWMAALCDGLGAWRGQRMRRIAGRMGGAQVRQRLPRPDRQADLGRARRCGQRQLAQVYRTATGRRDAQNRQLPPLRADAVGARDRRRRTRLSGAHDYEHAGHEGGYPTGAGRARAQTCTRPDADRLG